MTYGGAAFLAFHIYKFSFIKIKDAERRLVVFFGVCRQGYWMYFLFYKEFNKAQVTGMEESGTVSFGPRHIPAGMGEKPDS